MIAVNLPQLTFLKTICSNVYNNLNQLCPKFAVTIGFSTNKLWDKQIYSTFYIKFVQFKFDDTGIFAQVLIEFLNFRTLEGTLVTSKRQKQQWCSKQRFKTDLLKMDSLQLYFCYIIHYEFLHPNCQNDIGSAILLPINDNRTFKCMSKSSYFKIPHIAQSVVS